MSWNDFWILGCGQIIQVLCVLICKTNTLTAPTSRNRIEYTHTCGTLRTLSQESQSEHCYEDNHHCLTTRLSLLRTLSTSGGCTSSRLLPASYWEERHWGRSIPAPGTQLLNRWLWLWDSHCSRQNSLRKPLLSEALPMYIPRSPPRIPGIGAILQSEGAPFPSTMSFTLNSIMICCTWRTWTPWYIECPQGMWAMVVKTKMIIFALFTPKLWENLILFPNIASLKSVTLFIFIVKGVDSMLI